MIQMEIFTERFIAAWALAALELEKFGCQVFAQFPTDFKFFGVAVFRLDTPRFWICFSPRY